MINTKLYSIDDLYSFIDIHIVNKDIAKIVKSVIEEHEDEIKIATGGNHHHVYRGGLIQHSYYVANLCLKVIDMYDYVQINKDLLLAGAILHDLGKLDTSIEGNKLVAHNVKSAMMVVPYIENSNLNKRDKLALYNIVLTHTQSPYTKESMVGQTKSLEAIILHEADTIDAFTDGMSKELNSCCKGCFYDCNTLPQSMYKAEI